MTALETEIKIELSDPRSVIQKLRENGAVFLGAAKEKTIRIDTKSCDLEEKGLFLRVRGGFSNTITLKEKVGEDTTTRNRLETEFEIEDIDNMIYIFKRIGFNYIRELDKYRTMWSFQQVSIVIDELPFGIYMEIEGNEDQIKAVKQELDLMSESSVIETYWEINEKKNPNNSSIIFPQDYNLKLINM